MRRVFGVGNFLREVFSNFVTLLTGREMFLCVFCEGFDFSRREYIGGEGF